MGKLRLDTLLAELGLKKDDRAPASQPETGTPSSGPTAPASAGLILIDTTEPEGPFAAESAAGIQPAAPPDAGSAPPAAEASRSTLDGAAGRPADTLSDRRGDSPAAAATNADPLSDFRTLVLQRGLVSAMQFQAAETVVRQSPGARLIDILLEQGADEARLLEALAESLGMEFRRLKTADDAGPVHDDTLTNRLTPDFCKANQVLPLGVEAGRVVLATARPDDVFLLDEARLKLGPRPTKIVVAPASDIAAILAPLITPEEQAVNVDEILGDIEEDDVRVEAAMTTEVDLEKEAGESPVIRYVNYIIQTASKEGASDIHVEPGERSLTVRFRIDGELFEMMQPPARMAAAITSRLKIMANLDISERRLPQDGRIRCSVHGRKLDLRMSTIPTACGEKVVLRILDTRSINVRLDDLGFDENTLAVWKKQIEQPHGIVLVTGPTGSGKTTTLYASLRQMDKKTQNICTVEDPIEYHLDGITQTQTHEKIGMTFARALKALLRQDPDVILVGEIRDQETAHTAVQAALTGHLVLSTLHTNDAPSSITRLVNIGIEPFLLGAAMNAALAQRLVRRICQHCKGPAKLTDDMRELLAAQGIATEGLLEGQGCARCRNTGYQGRLGIYELLIIDDHLRDIIARNPNVSEFRRLCRERGMATLREDGLEKARRGLTTVQEVLRTTEAVA